MSTRTAKDDTVLRQSRYASSPEFSRGLIANLVAKRCEIIEDKSDRELIWFVQYLSYQPGGLAAVADELIARFSDRLGTPAMVNSRKEVYQFSEVEKLRLEIPKLLRGQFPLHGETVEDIAKLCGHQVANLPYDRRRLLAESDYYKEATPAHPSFYPESAFLKLCREAAATGFEESDTNKLERKLGQMCLDPEWNLSNPAHAPWYFSDLLNVLREYREQWSKDKSRVVLTQVGRKVYETLDYTLKAGILSLLLGESNLGQSFAARAWCEQHAGQARFVDVPPSNDEASFYRVIARGLGLGNFLNYKNVQIRERVEAVLRTGHIMLVLNQAQNLWPQKNLREAFPGRLAWLLDQVDQGASVCMISGPQFFMQKRACEKSGWDSPALQGKILHCDYLPSELSVSDMLAITRFVLPEISLAVAESVAIYAVGQGRYLGALEAIAKRAHFIACQAGRDIQSAQDVVEAIKIVGHSDKQLRESFENANANPRQTKRPTVPKSEPIEDVEQTRPLMQHRQTALRTGVPIASHRGETMPELIQG